MAQIILGVRYTKTGKLHYMDPMNFGFKVGDLIIANSERGQEIGRVVSIKKKEELSSSVKIEKIIKPATKYDVARQHDNEKEAKKALKKCKEIANELNLSMKLIHSEYMFDNSKLIFYFASEDRVDFRELVRQLATEYKTRIEMKQVGPRDEVKLCPNLGMCGKEVCCRTFLPDFEAVTIKMAKEQGLQINMPKISGACGRLMCCLKYEQDLYKEHMKDLPKNGEYVTYKGESAKVVGLDVLNKKIKLKIGKAGEETFETVEMKDIVRDKKYIKEEKKEQE